MEPNFDQREYVLNKVDPIYRALMADVVRRKPAEIIDYMINWLIQNKSKNFSNKENIQRTIWKIERKLECITVPLMQMQTHMEMSIQERIAKVQ